MKGEEEELMGSDDISGEDPLDDTLHFLSLVA
jgi:hypothetical protein